MSQGRGLTTRPRNPDALLEVLRADFAPAATDAELAYFDLVCKRLDLDPWAGHIYLIPYKGVHRPQISVAGRRVIAFRTGRLRGIEGPQWCQVRRVGPDGTKLPLEWLDVWEEENDHPYAARVLVWPEGWQRPANGTVKWSEFADEKSPTWTKMPSHMLGKVAESLALRRAFPEVDAAVAGLERAPDEDATYDAEDPVDADTGELPPARDDDRAAGPAPGVPSARRARTRRPPGDDRPPDSLYDNLPEAQGR